MYFTCITKFELHSSFQRYLCISLFIKLPIRGPKAHAE